MWVDTSSCERSLWRALGHRMCHTATPRRADRFRPDTGVRNQLHGRKWNTKVTILVFSSYSFFFDGNSFVLQPCRKSGPADFRFGQSRTLHHADDRMNHCKIVEFIGHWSVIPGPETKRQSISILVLHLTVTSSSLSTAPHRRTRFLRRHHTPCAPKEIDSNGVTLDQSPDQVFSLSLSSSCIHNMWIQLKLNLGNHKIHSHKLALMKTMGANKIKRVLR